MFYRLHRLPLFLGLLLLLASCASVEEIDPTKNWSASKIYLEASDALGSGDYQTAIKYYELLQARFPFGKYAIQSQIDLAYTYYKDDEPEACIAAADRFLRLHPKNPAAPYAWYLKGLANFNRNIGFISRYVPTDSSQRDPGATLDSYKDFSELIRRFPDSEYAKDAEKRLIYLRNNLARHETHVAAFYMKKGAYVAAANRAAVVIEKYQRTPAVREALNIMIQAYTRLGKKKLADDARRVLALNEERGNLSSYPEDLEEPTLSKKFWDYLELDKN